jgi:hypothetical protein
MLAAASTRRVAIVEHFFEAVQFAQADVFLEVHTCSQNLHKKPSILDNLKSFGQLTHSLIELRVFRHEASPR